MVDKQRKRRHRLPLITVDMLTFIVYISLLFCACIVVWGMVQASNGIDCAAIVDSALRVFGTELGICGVLTMYKRWVELQDRRAESRRKYRQEEMYKSERKNDSDDSKFIDS